MSIGDCAPRVADCVADGPEPGSKGSCFSPLQPFLLSRVHDLAAVRTGATPGGNDTDEGMKPSELAACEAGGVARPSGGLETQLEEGSVLFGSAAGPAAVGDGAAESEKEELHAWLADYAAGKWSCEEVPTPPPSILALLDSSTHVFSHWDPNLPTTVKKDARCSTPEEFIAFYRDHGYLPPPRGPMEDERLKLMSRYGLDNDKRKATVDRICRLARAHFGFPTVVVSLVFDSHLLLFSEIGFRPQDPPLSEPVLRLAMEPSICAHHMTMLDQNSTFVIPDTSSDWRWMRNPLSACAGGAISFYASANIRLPLPLPMKVPGTDEMVDVLPVGTLCLLDSKPHDKDELTDADKAMLNEYAELIAQEFRLGREEALRARSDAQADFLGELLTSSLALGPVSNTSRLSPRLEAVFPAELGHAIGASSSSTADSEREKTPSEKTADRNTLSQVRKLVRADFVAVLDLRAFRATSWDPRMGIASPMTNGGPSSPSARKRSATFSQEMWKSVREGMRSVPEQQEDFGIVRVMAEDQDPSLPPWHAPRGDDLARLAAASLAAYHETGELEFHASSSKHSPFDGALPAGTLASVIVPIFDTDATPTLLIVASTAEKFSQFEKAESRFLGQFGAVCMGTVLRQRAADADRAKLAFVGQVSHELRTPLHGVYSQVELIRELSSPEQLRTLSPLLDTAEVCLETLRDVLDDTLSFSKLANTSIAEQQSQHVRSLVRTDIAKLVESVAQASWVKKTKVDRVLDVAATNGTDPGPGVELRLELQVREGGWEGYVDPAGLKRVLLNLVGNALKFTDTGSVKIRLSMLSSGPGRSVASFEVIDTGVGMSEAFLRDRRLFTPFVQESSFSQGAGLGLSIVDNICKRMGGEVDVLSAKGRGTSFRVTLPIEFTSPSTPASPQEEWRTFVVSQELGSLSPIAAEAPASPWMNPRTSPLATSSLSAEPLGLKQLGESIKELAGAMEPPPYLSAASALPVEGLALKRPTSRPQQPAAEVLVVDDNQIARRVLTKMLSVKGISYVEAEDGQQAVDAYREAEGRFLMVCMDLQMPVKDGLVASKEIREYETLAGLEPTYIVALTGLSDSRDKDAGIHGHEEGPFSNWVVKGGGKTLKLVVSELERLRSQASS